MNDETTTMPEKAMGSKKDVIASDKVYELQKLLRFITVCNDYLPKLKQAGSCLNKCVKSNRLVNYMYILLS